MAKNNHLKIATVFFDEETGVYSVQLLGYYAEINIASGDFISHARSVGDTISDAIVSSSNHYPEFVKRRK